MKKVNKFFVDYVNKVSSVTTRKQKTVNSVLSRNLQKEVKESLNAIAFRDYVIRDYFEMSVRQSAGHFAALEKSTWNQFLGQHRLDLFSIQSDWSLGKSSASENLAIHRRVYQVTSAGAAITCHPVEIYSIIYRKINWQVLDFLPGGAFEDFAVMTRAEIEAADSIPKAVFSFSHGLTVWGDDLFSVVNDIDKLVFSSKLALLKG